MKLKDFNTIIPETTISPDDATGNFIERTESSFNVPEAYLLNPITLLLTELSGFKPEFWASYAGYNWIEMDFPAPVLEHTKNHYRAVALTMLRKEAPTVDTIFKLANVALGFPFALFPGVVYITEETGSFLIKQYAFKSSITTEDIPTVSYRISNTLALNFEDGEMLDSYAPLIKDSVKYYDYTKDGDTWFSSFDINNVVPLKTCAELDFLVNKKRVVGIERTNLSGYNYNFKFFEQLMVKVMPEDCILLYKENEVI